MIIIGAVQGKIRRHAENRLFCWSTAGAVTWRNRKVGDQTRVQNWTPELQGRTLSFGEEESRMEKLGWRRAEC